MAGVALAFAAAAAVADLVLFSGGSPLLFFCADAVPLNFLFALVVVPIPAVVGAAAALAAAAAPSSERESDTGKYSLLDDADEPESVRGNMD